MNKVLIVAYHFPPIGVSSGVHRTLAYTRYLMDNNWQPSVLTINPKSYQERSNDQVDDIPESVTVVRAFGFDASKLFSICGKYPSFLALPDRWGSWILGGVITGLKMIKKDKPDIIYSTYPIASAHVIAYILHKLTGIPWVSDFRDPMAETIDATEPLKQSIYKWIEKITITSSVKTVFTTEGTRIIYATKYSKLPVSKWKVVENGFDEKYFTDLCLIDNKPEVRGGLLLLLHSGFLYRADRDPTSFFEAISELKNEGAFEKESLRVVLRASGYEDEYSEMINALNIGNIVKLAPSIGYVHALKEMHQVSGLLIFQGETCNQQVPAKLYEYLRVGKPVFALTDMRGDTASVLQQAGIHSLASISNKLEIKVKLKAFILSLSDGSPLDVNKTFVQSCSRESRTKELAVIFNEALEEG